MTDILKHECGIAIVRLRKPLQYYQEQYGTWMYGLNKLYLLMEKQHNRGQDGAGLAVVKMSAPPGEEYLFRERAEGSGAISEIFSRIHHQFADYSSEELYNPKFVEQSIPFAGECYMGHLRYSTTGKRGLTYIHPMERRSNWRAKSLALCGNFNLTNVDAIFKAITDKGQHPRITSDTHIMLEQIGHALDREVERLYRIGKNEHSLEGMDITHFIEERISIGNVLKRCAPLWDGGYVMCGETGNGEVFAFRDAHGIRPAFYYIDDEIVVVASERAVIQTVMSVSFEEVKELQPGEALIVNQAGDCNFERILEEGKNEACSFERIYFSRASDKEIYHERKALGRQLVPDILEAVDHDLDHTVFSFIPNTAEVAYYGMMEGLRDHLNGVKAKEISQLQNPTEEQIKSILSKAVRSEKVAIKDIKLRTFIAEGNSRNDLAAHVYDVTYGSIVKNVDRLVIIDDSIVRGTTLKQSILRMLTRLGPTKIVIASSAPQIRYPDCYGIDMRHMEEFIAFRAAVALHHRLGTASVIMDQYRKALAYVQRPKTEIVPNVVKAIYKPFTAEEITRQIAEMVRPEECSCPISIVFQSIEGLRAAIPEHPGAWYFTGDYPTPGGYHLVNESFIRYVEDIYMKHPN